MPHKPKWNYDQLLDENVITCTPVVFPDITMAIGVDDDPADHVYYNHNFLVMDERLEVVDDDHDAHAREGRDTEVVATDTTHEFEDDKEDYKDVVVFRGEKECEACEQLKAARISGELLGGGPRGDIAERLANVDLRFATLCDWCRKTLKNEEDDIYEVPQTSSPEVIYDTVADTSSLYSDVSWSDSEFESYSDDAFSVHDPLPKTPKPSQRRTVFNIENGVLMKIRNNFLQKPASLNPSSVPIIVPLILDDDKHPSPSLPPAPEGLSVNQTKRRHVMASIIHSEQSYVRSLQYILQEYRDFLLDVNYLFRGTVRVILRKVAELIQYHKMFQIELAEAAQTWDETESIGDVFTASFSKSLVVDAYSEYVNNYAAAMEDIRKMIRQKQSFADTLKHKEAANPDRLSVFSLMVKPVQRFPQFIMFLQDLLKYTTCEHHDRMKLQRAITELEGIAHKLNDRKRESEQKLAAKQIVSTLLKETIAWRSSLVVDNERYLVRQDGMYQVVGHTTPQVYKWRRLIMLSDLVICVNVQQRQRDNEVATERYKVKWCAPVKEVELKETSITPDMYSDMKNASRWHSFSSLRLEPTDEDPLGMLTDLTDLIYDYSVLSQIQTLAASLRRFYPGVTDTVIDDTMTAVQLSIHQKDEQARLVGSCSFVLDVPIRGSRRRYVFQAMSAHHKEDWITDLNMAKLSLSPQNRPSWSMIRGAEDQGSSNPALFLKCLTVDVPRHYTKVQCAVPVSLKSSTYCSTSINHLWVCSSTQSSGQVSLIALQCTRPRIIESFLAASSKIVCIELVPGYGCHDNPYAFPAATVWMATSRDEMVIYDVQNGAGLKRQARAMFKVAAGVTLMQYVIGQLFVALASGKLAIYSRDVDGVWNVSSPKVVTIGQKAVTCLLVIDDYLTCMSDNSISMLNPSSHEIERVLSLDCEECSVIQDVARAGMGLWISYRNSSLIHLYHLETMDRLQDINISSVVQKSISGNCDYYSGFVSVSCLVTSKGLLWIGTNTGHILTLPLPRLRDGVPQITSRPDISYHSHQGPVRFIIPLYSTVIPTETMPVIRIGPACDKVEVIHETTPMDYINHEVIIKNMINPTLKMAEQARDTATSYDELKSKNSASSFSNSSLSTESDVFLSKEDLDLAFQIELRERLLQHAKKWKSTPNLMESDTTEDVKVLYGSLMKTCDGPDTTAPLRPVPRARDIRTLAAVGRKCYTRAMRWRRGQSENIDAYVRNNVKPSLRTHAAFVEPKQRSQSLATPADRLVTEVEGPGADTSLTSVSDVEDTFTTPVSQSSFFCDPPATVSSPTPTTPADCVHTSPTCERSPRRHGFSKAVMVVCGGDGYCNWSQDTPKLTRNDASIMVWMYKADF